MKALIYYALTHAHHHKTAKAYTILSQVKISSNLFDASSQQLLSLYHSLPHLKYPSFERFLRNFRTITRTITRQSTFILDILSKV